MNMFRKNPHNNGYFTLSSIEKNDFPTCFRPKSDPKLTSNSLEIEFKDSTSTDSHIEFRNSDTSLHKSSESHRSNGVSEKKDPSRTFSSNIKSMGGKTDLSSVSLVGKNKFFKGEGDNAIVSQDKTSTESDSSSSLHISRLDELSRDEYCREFSNERRSFGRHEDRVAVKQRNVHTVHRSREYQGNQSVQNYFFPESQTISMVSEPWEFEQS